MKSAKVYVAVVELKCPHCDEHLSCPDHGSHMWSYSDVLNHPTTECDYCNLAVKVPARAHTIFGMPAPMHKK